MPDYFTLAELRALPDVSNATTYPDSLVEAASAYITAIIEREVGTSFISRSVVDEVHDGGEFVVRLRKRFVRSATSATLDGVAVTEALRVQAGMLRRFSESSYSPIRWTSGVGNVLVTYSAGYSATPPADIKEAALQGTRARLLDTSSKAVVNDRRSSVTNEVGGTTSYVLAGEDRPTGYPEVDAVILGWKNRLRAPMVG